MNADDAFGFSFQDMYADAQDDDVDTLGPAPTNSAYPGTPAAGPDSSFSPSVPSVIRRRPIPSRYGERSLSPVPEAQPDHETQHDDEEDENLDEPGSKEAADEIARIAIEQAQQQAKDQALIGRVWASNDSGESVMRKLQGSAGALLETFSVIFVLVSTMPGRGDSTRI